MRFTIALKLNIRGIFMHKKSENWISHSKTFNASADYYDKFRPTYPENLVIDIIKKTGVNSKSKILEIGAGSGKATELFVKRGLNITCIEPGSNLAAEGKKKFQHTNQVKYIISRFEEWQEVSGFYDLIISAQAFHWVPKPLGYEKCFNALKTDKHMALFWNFYLSSGEEVDVELQDLFKEYPVAYLDSKESLENRINQNIDEIKGIGLFKNIEVIRYPWSQVYSIEDYIGFLKTGNGYLILNNEKKEIVEDKVREIMGRHGGNITKFYECTLFLAQKS